MSDSEKNKNRKSSHGEVFNDFLTTIDRLFAEKPIKGLLQSMDDFFSTFERGFPVELIEKETHFHIKATLPGIKRDQIDIEMLAQGVIITVKNAKVLKIHDNKGQSRKKHTSNIVSRTISLPKPIDEQKATASHRDGVLEIKVPKLRGKRIAIID